MIADLETIGGADHVGDMAAVPLIATSAHSSLRAAVAAVKGGAVDFLPKPIGAKMLMERLDAAVQAWRPSPRREDAERGATAQRPGADRNGLRRLHRPLAGDAARSTTQIRRMAPSRAPGLHHRRERHRQGI